MRGFIVSTKILSSKTLIIMRRISWAANQHIRMISEGLCDTETSLCKQHIYKCVLLRNHTKEYMNECISEGSGCLQKRFDGILFSSSLHVIIPNKVAFLSQCCFVDGDYRKTALTLLFHICFCHLLSESGFTETLTFTFSLCAVFVWPKNSQNLHAQL